MVGTAELFLRLGDSTGSSEAEEEIGFSMASMPTRYLDGFLAELWLRD